MHDEGLKSKPDKERKRKRAISISDIIMKQCRIVLRHGAAADDAKVFCTLLGSKLVNSSDNDDEGLLGAPAMVSRPLDFRTIDLRLAVGAYGGSWEAFLEDIREVSILCLFSFFISRFGLIGQGLAKIMVVYSFNPGSCLDFTSFLVDK